MVLQRSVGPGVWEKSKSVSLTLHSGELCAGPWVEPGQSYYDDTPYDGTAFGSVWIEGIYDGPSSAAADSVSRTIGVCGLEATGGSWWMPGPDQLSGRLIQLGLWPSISGGSPP